jgi:hypothetical protein
VKRKELKGYIARALEFMDSAVNQPSAISHQPSASSGQ